MNRKDKKSDKTSDATQQDHTTILERQRQEIEELFRKETEQMIEIQKYLISETQKQTADIARLIYPDDDQDAAVEEELKEDIVEEVGRKLPTLKSKI